MANEPYHLYDLEDYFRLLINGVWIYIEEPIGWDKISIKLERDKDYIGLNYEFVDPTVKLIFEFNEGGGQQLKTHYETYGSDADAKFEYGYRQLGAMKRQYAGTVNFNDYNRVEEGVEITIEKTVFASLLRTRYDTKVAMNATTDLDGNAIIPPTPIHCKLHSKKLTKYGRAEGTSGTDLPVVEQGTSSSHGVYLQPDTTNIVKQEVEELQSMPLGLSIIAAVDEQRFQYTPTEAGTARLKWKCEYDLEIISFITNIGDYNFTGNCTIWRNGAAIRIYAPARVSGHISSGSGTWHRTIEFELTQQLQINDEVYFSDNITYDSSLAIARARNYVGFIEVTQETIAPASFCDGYKIFDVLNHVVACLTGRQNSVQSSFFGPGGCGEKWMITNGYQVRVFNIAQRPVQVAMKDALEGAAPIWCLGVQYSFDTSGQDIIIIEPAPAFFKSRRLFTFDAVWDYEDAHARDVTYNEAEMGYNKFSDEELNTLDEFNTTGTWLLPIRSYKQKYSKKSSFVTSGYSIEIARREQFKVNPSTSINTDDDLFLIGYITERRHKGVNFSAAGGSSVQFSKPVGMLAGDTFYVLKDGGGANDGTLFTVNSKDNSSSVERYSVSPSPAADSGVGDVLISVAGPEAEKNEAFDIVDGVLSPETAYNLRISPLHMLFNHAEWINGCLEKKINTDLITNTFFKNNGLLRTQFSPSAPCARLDNQTAILKETDSIMLQDFQSRRQLFTPSMATFKARIQYDQLIYMKERLIGQTGTADDYGVVAHPDRDGRWWESYVWAMEYQPDSETLTMKVRKKRQIA